VRDRAAIRVAIGPNAERVVLLANGRLFARPLGESKPWQTKSTLGYAHDFAFHPCGNIICAVFEDGHARYLDALTGAVKQSFQWSKKSKPLYSVAFAPDGLTCAAGGENGRVVIWDVDL
jgi:WD40 repeat protein